MRLHYFILLFFGLISNLLFSQHLEIPSLFLSNRTANIGDTVTIDITVKNFKNLKDFRADLTYNYLELEYITFSNPAFSDMNVKEFFPGKVVAQLTNPNFTYQLPDNTVLLKARFKVLTVANSSNSILVHVSAFERLDGDLLLQKNSYVGYGACINVNNKPVSKLRVDSKLTIKKCTAGFSIAVENTGETALNRNFTWRTTSGLNEMDTLETESPQYIELELLDNLDNKGFITYSIGLGSFGGIELFSFTHDFAPIDCQKGKLTINPTGGKPPYTYQLDNLPISTSNVFNNVTNGEHIVYVIDSEGCSTGGRLYIGAEPLSCQYSFEQYGCTSNKGQLKITPQYGTPQYKTYLDGILQSADNEVIIGNVTAGSHTIKIVDASGCEFQITINCEVKPRFQVSGYVGEGDCVSRLVIASIITDFYTQYEHRLDNGAFQASSIFRNVPIGKHTVTVRDTGGCTVTSAEFVVAPISTTRYTKEIIRTDCTNQTVDFKVKPYNSTAPYTITHNGLAMPADSIFKNVRAGYYLIKIVDGSNCVLSIQDTVRIDNGQILTSYLRTQYDIAPCKSAGTLSVLLPDFLSNAYQFRLDNGTFSSNRVFTNVSIGQHLLYIQGANLCMPPLILNLKQDSTTTFKYDKFFNTVGCTGSGTLSIMPSGGIAPYKVFLDNMQSDTQYIIRNVQAGIYTIKIIDAQGCELQKRDTLIGINAFDLKPIDTLCINYSDTVIILKPTISQNAGRLRYQWSTGSTDSILRVYNTLTYIVTVSNEVGCTKTETFTFSKCVWPGDTDTSGVVDAKDLLQLGLGFGSTGAKRNDNDINWYAHKSPDWTIDINRRYYTKHLDCNGDGIVNALDTTAIAKNWGLTHSLRKPNIPVVVRNNTPPIYIRAAQVIDGSNSLAIMLGETIIMATNVYGVAFTIDFNENIIDANSVYVTFNASWLQDNVVISMYKVQDGKVQIGIVRTNRQPISGAGAIGRINFKTKKNAVLKDIAFVINNPLIINELGQEIASQGRTTIVNSSTHVQYSDNVKKVILYPNPASDNLYLDATGLTIHKILVLDYTGKTVWVLKSNVPQIEIPLSILSEGMYLLQIHTDKGIVTKSFAKI